MTEDKKHNGALSIFQLGPLETSHPIWIDEVCKSLKKVIEEGNVEAAIGIIITAIGSRHGYYKDEAKFLCLWACAHQFTQEMTLKALSDGGPGMQIKRMAEMLKYAPEVEKRREKFKKSLEPAAPKAEPEPEDDGKEHLH